MSGEKSSSFRAWVTKAVLTILGAIVLGEVLKAIWPELVALLLVVCLVRWLFRRPR